MAIAIDDDGGRASADLIVLGESPVAAARVDHDCSRSRANTAAGSPRSTSPMGRIGAPVSASSSSTSSSCSAAGVAATDSTSRGSSSNGGVGGGGGGGPRGAQHPPEPRGAGGGAR